MSNSYVASVNDSSEYEVSPKAISQLDVISVNEDTYHVIQDKRSTTVTITSADLTHKIYNIRVGNNSYRVVLLDEVDQLIRKMGFSIGQSKLVNSLEAPMPGLILDVQVGAGEAVKEGDTLLILSAMKMENSILSPRDGVIRTVHVAKNDAIDKGQLLIEFEA
ncbi:acetyl-CoA carboxylase biotin carboxyl carrier protein subunit [Pukyongia salina]|uniref:Acetyl-CoA carboxylase biotin carboxyl carrier protein subunit n=1 Tax=Pukyongia salina TaxID=2094025 RepID=A0A2S0HUU7_9FLAO|nr:biotin/lipoyl-containing protein [Pukyongia salina]AVI50461.1 acetyl-CoA carboxylase biotin carboxyl carrier protein subunit [Pukyongia salina]